MLNILTRLKGNPFYNDLLSGNLENIPDDERLAKMMSAEQLELFNTAKRYFYEEKPDRPYKIINISELLEKRRKENRRKANFEIQAHPLYEDLMNGNLKVMPSEQILAKTMSPEQLKVFKNDSMLYFDDLEEEELAFMFNSDELWEYAFGEDEPGESLMESVSGEEEDIPPEELAKLLKKYKTSPEHIAWKAHEELKDKVVLQYLFTGELKKIPPDELLSKIMSQESFELFKQIRHAFLKQRLPEPATQATPAGPSRRKFSRCKKASAILILFLISALGASIYHTTRPVTATKEFFFDLQNKLAKSKDVQIKSDELKDIWKFNGMEQISKAIAVYPDLCVPEYIPKGYSLEVLQINQASDVYTVLYHFQKDEADYYWIHIVGDEIIVVGTISEEEKTLILKGLT